LEWFGKGKEREKILLESFVPPAKSFRFRQCPADWKVNVTAVLYFLYNNKIININTSTW
jgi:hypothetical protein